MQPKLKQTFLCLLATPLLACADFTILQPDAKPDSYPPGTLTMNAQWAETPFGTAAYCSSQDGDSIVIPDSEASRLGTGDFSLTIWLCPHDLTASSRSPYRRLFEKNNWPKDFWVLDIYPDGMPMFTMRDKDMVLASIKSPKTKLVLNAWNFLALTVDRTNHTVSFYLNGVLTESIPFQQNLKGTLDIQGKPLLISSFHKVVGLVGQTTMKKTQLTPEQILNDYNSGKGIYTSTDYKAAPRRQTNYPIPHPAEKPPVSWDMATLLTPPKTYPITTEPFNAMVNDDIKPLMFDSVPYQGKPTRVFAWYGAPKNADANHPVPAMVLIHGGGGTAFRKWVKLWNDRGYAAIAMDTCGHLPLPLDTDSKPWPTHDWSGPAGWGDYRNMAKPLTDHWAYHAVAAVVRAHSLIRSFPEVDSSRIGVTGISWGGYLTCLVAGVDNRFRFAVPVYGCGFLTEGSAWLSNLRAMTQQHAQSLTDLWDPAQYLSSVTMPMLFCNGTHDRFFWPKSWMKTTLLPKGDVYRYYKVNMPHGHAPSGDPAIITTFANAILKGERQIPSFQQFTHKDGRLEATFQNVESVKNAELIWSPNYEDSFNKRQWNSIPATYDPQTKRLTGVIPATAKAAYLAITDDRGLYASSDVVFIP